MDTSDTFLRVTNELPWKASLTKSMIRPVRVSASRNQLCIPTSVPEKGGSSGAGTVMRTNCYTTATLFEAMGMIFC